MFWNSWKIGNFKQWRKTIFDCSSHGQFLNRKIKIQKYHDHFKKCKSFYEIKEQSKEVIILYGMLSVLKRIRPKA